jgi:hypothetical protein
VTAFIINALAVWRLSSLIVREDGPLDVFYRVRRAAGAEDEGQLSNLAKGLTCVWCVSVWIAIATIVLRLVFPKSFLLLIPLALSAVAVLVDETLRTLGKDRD